MVDYILARLKEKTTYVGIFALLSAAGVQVAPDLWTAIVSAASAIAGLVLVAMKEKEKE